MEEQPIYRIFVFENPDKEMVNSTGKPMGWPDTGALDDVGFYYEKETAIQALHENWCDIQDCCYHAAFLVKHLPGLYPAVDKENRIYFLWNEKRKGFFEAKEPKIFEHIAY